MTDAQFLIALADHLESYPTVVSDLDIANLRLIAEKLRDLSE